MKKMFYMLIMAMMTPLLSGCFGKGSSADPPANFSATEGDGRVILTWDPAPSIDYWIFTSTVPSMTAFNWANLPYAHAYINAATPFYMCGLFSGTQYYFAANGRTNGGPGGTSSPTITTANPPYNASTVPWTSGFTSPTTPNFLGVGYTSLTTCSNIPFTAISAAGSFAAVGAGGAIFTGTFAIGPPYSINWTSQAAPGFTTNLNAVTGYAAYQNNPSNPALRWVAVGDAGTSVYSTDGITWTVGGSSITTTQALRSITHFGGTFVAVGDGGTILSTIDGGLTWTPHTAPPPVTTTNLNGVTHGSIYVAVGDSGTLLTSVDGNTWTLQPSVASLTSNILRQVAYYGSIIVAVGDSGTIVTSINNGATWTSQIQGTSKLVGVAAETQFVINPVPDTLLGYISTVQFVAVDSAGNIYTSQNGIVWSGPIGAGTGIATNALVSSGFGYVAVGTGGATAYAF